MKALEHGITEASVSAVVTDALGSFPEPSPVQPSLEPAAATSVRIVFTQANLTGAWNGAVNLRVPVPLAASLASAIFGIPADDISAAERADVVAELCNTVAGNLKGLIRGKAALSLPTVREGDARAVDPHAAFPAGTVAVNLAYPFLGQLIAVQVIDYEDGTP